MSLNVGPLTMSGPRSGRRIYSAAKLFGSLVRISAAIKVKVTMRLSFLSLATGKTARDKSKSQEQVTNKSREGHSKKEGVEKWQ